MKPIRFLLIGGFLGAGKTTTIARLARHYMAQGLRVGLVTNDQAYDLVDTKSLRAQGFQVGEVPGACFCCKFDDLVSTAESLGEAEQPDLILAEPVGSCTDLMATVIEPLRQLYPDRYQMGRFAVLLKPEHGRKILGQQPGSGFSPKAEYIFLKQVEEADLVVLNKVDKLDDTARRELTKLVAARFPGKQLLTISARLGDGFDSLIAALETTPPTRTSPLMEVDYDTYAEGEAELGWLNCQVEVAAKRPLSMDQLLIELVAALGEAFRQEHSEAAHLKVLAQAGEHAAIANLVDNESKAELSLAAEVEVAELELTINARVAADPEQLAATVQAVLAQLAAEHQLTHRVRGLQHFRPGRPVPTHRVTR